PRPRLPSSANGHVRLDPLTSLVFGDIPQGGRLRVGEVGGAGTESPRGTGGVTDTRHRRDPSRATLEIFVGGEQAAAQDHNQDEDTHPPANPARIHKTPFGNGTGGRRAVPSNRVPPTAAQV